MMDISFRIADKNDLPALKEMIRSFYLEDHHDFKEEGIEMALSEILSNGDIGVVYLIGSDDNIAGYFILTYGWSLEYLGKDVFIDELFVKKEFRGSGIGKKSLEFIEDLVKSKKIRTIHLEVNKFNIARKLYESREYVSHNSDLMSKRF